jgi:two-component system cell cycle sensor histidine kinase/response regulator CckA
MTLHLRALVAEDNPNDELLLLAALRRTGIAVDHVRVQSAGELKAALASGPWDVVLSDFHMPQFTGLDALDIVRDHDPDLPVIIISGTIGEDIAVRAMRAGASDFMVKGKLQRLGEAVRREIEAARVRREQARATAEVEHLERVLAAIRSINRLIVRERDPDALLRQACELLVTTRGYRASWAAVFPHGELGDRLLQACLGDAFHPCQQAVAEGGMPRCLRTARDAPHGVSVVDIIVLCDPCPHEDPRHDGPILSAALSFDGEQYGLLCVAVPPDIEVSAREIGLMAEVAGDLGMALHHIAAARRHQRILEQYQQLFAAAPQLITSVDAQGILRNVNHRVQHILGYQPDELIGQPMGTIIHPDDHPKAQASLEAILTAGHSEDQIYTMVRKDGEHRTVSINSAALRGDDGEYQASICVIDDITERLAADRAIEDQRLLLRFSVEQSPVPTVIATAPEIRLLHANAAALELLVRPADDPHAITAESAPRYWPFLQPDGTPYELEQRPLTRAIRQRETVHGEEFVIRHADGDRICLGHATPLEDQHGHVVAGMFVFPEITELRRAEEELRRFEWLLDKEARRVSSYPEDVTSRDLDLTRPNRSRVILDAVGPELLESVGDDLMALLDSSVAVYEANGDYAYARCDSHWCRRLLEGSFERCVTDDVEEALRCGAWLCHESCWRESAEPTIQRGEITDVECVGGIRLYAVPIRAGDEIVGALNIGFGNPPDQPERLAELSERFGVPLDELTAHAQRYKPRPEFILEIARQRAVTAAHMIGEIVARHRAEEARLQLNAQLQQAQKLESIGRLAGGIAHDFNNMLAVIGTYAELIMDGLPAESETRDDVREIVTASQRAAALTTQLLAFGRKKQVDPTVLDLNTVIEQMEKMLRRTIGEDLMLTTKLVEPLQSVYADRGGVEQLLMNLVINARDAMPSGGRLTIETANVQLDETYAGEFLQAEPGAYVMLAVTDTGCGMSPEVKDQIFEPFFTTKSLGEGTGLGLATVYGFVRQSQGGLRVYSEPGVGTCIKVFLPVSRKATEEEVSQHPPRTLSGSETILLVEDEEAVRRIGERLLGAAGYLVLTASDPDEALRVCALLEEPPDLLLTDVVMPKMSGRELADRLQQRFPELPVLFMSGYTDEAVTLHGMLGPGRRFISKPFDRQGLLAAIRGALMERHPDGQASSPGGATPCWTDNPAGTLPFDLVERLVATAEQGDVAALRQHIGDEVRTLAPELADRLGEMLDAYSYDALIDTVRCAGASTNPKEEVREP